MEQDAVQMRFQIGLNRRMYETGHIPYDTFCQAHEVLLSRLKSCRGDDIISRNERRK